MSSTLNPKCINSPTFAQDQSFHSLVVQEKLTACKTVSSTVETNQLRSMIIDTNTIYADTITSNDLVVNNITILGTGGSSINNTLTIVADDTNSVNPDNTNTLTITGSGGNYTSSTVVNTLEIVDKRSLTPFVVGINATTAEYTDITTAITAASAAGGGLVLVTAGSYTGFTLNDINVTVKGVSVDRVQITTATTLQNGTVEDLKFSDVLNVTGAEAYVKGCRLDGTPNALSVDMTGTLFIRDCFSYNSGILSLLSGTFIGKDLYFPQSTFSATTSAANNKYFLCRMTSCEFFWGSFQGDMSTTVGDAVVNDCIFRVKLSIGPDTGPPSSTDIINFTMNGGSANECTVNLLSPANNTTPHGYECMFNGVDFATDATSIPRFILINGLATLNGCHFAYTNVVSGTGLFFVQMGLSALVNSIIQVRNCSFAVYGTGVTCTCLYNSNTTPGSPTTNSPIIYHVNNVVQPSTAFYAGNTISTTGGGGAFVAESVF